ncbi:hypothetical protein CYLTODRAFT_494938 [Cylindrobasidium torrendii FP15055 ss-10]|uniref:Uncharacterized protein n=1 Tax=Cylindrobasidium torrendii FP15055 ss-10 TaxID=1314674 RepID=A0A0D7AVG4_9AGAR|nr:hypothetical protein CYLTODRAFT_494938 [Cylindrobasidium torrendii FP15055 ss-10]
MRTKWTTHYPPRPSKGIHNTRKNSSTSNNTKKIPGAKKSANARSSGKANLSSSGISKATRAETFAAAAGSMSTSGPPGPMGSGREAPSSTSQEKRRAVTSPADGQRRKRAREDSPDADEDPDPENPEPEKEEQVVRDLQDVTDKQRATFIKAWQRAMAHADEEWLARNRTFLIPGSALCEPCHKAQRPCSRRRAERKWRAAASAKVNGLGDDVLENLIEDLGLNAMEKNLGQIPPPKADRRRVKAGDEASPSELAHCKRGASERASTKDVKMTSAARGATRLRKPPTFARMAVFEDDPPSEVLLAEEVHVWFGSDGEVIDEGSREDKQVEKTPSLASMTPTPEPEPIPQSSEERVPAEHMHKLNSEDGAMIHNDTEAEAHHLPRGPPRALSNPLADFQLQVEYPQNPPSPVTLEPLQKCIGEMTSVPDPQGPGGGHNKGRSLIPVKIAQLLKCAKSGQGFLLDDTQLDHVCLVALITNVTESKANTKYVIDDGTGSIDVWCWGESRNDVGMREIDGQAYVRVIGELQALGTKRYIHSRMPLHTVEDYHEVIYHDLECISAYLYRVNGPPPVGRQASTLAGLPKPVPEPTEYEARWEGLPSLHLAIVRYLLKNQGHDGISVAQIVANAVVGPDGLPAALADETSAFDDLLGGGFVSTTVDESTFRLN